MKFLRKLFQNKTVQNSGWLIGGKLAQMLISLVVSLLTARYLGPSNFGLISYASSYTAFFTSLCTLGINSLLVKELVDKPEKEGEILGTSIGLRAMSSFLSALTIVALVSVIDRNEPVTIWVTVLCSLGLIIQVTDAFIYWFQRHLQARYTAIATFVAYVVTAAFRVVLVISGQSVVLFALATAVDHVVLGAFLIYFYRKNGGQRLGFSWKYGKDLLSRSKYFILSGMMIAIYGQTDKLMLKQMLDVTQTGFYATATTVNNLWCFALSAVIQSLVPGVMEAFKAGDMALFKSRNKQLYAIVFYVSVAVAVLFNIFADLVIWILYGAEFMPAAMPLRIVSWYTAFSYLGVARDPWIVSMNRQKHLFKLYASAAAANVILNYCLIPLWGASGAAVASLVAQILTGFVLPFFIKDLRPNAKLMLEAIMLKGALPGKQKN